jgi:hypothetical protein
MKLCKRKDVMCECLTDHSSCNTDNCHRKLPDKEGSVLTDKLTYELLEVATELDSCETSNNCVIARLQGVSWLDLCDRGIKILKLLKEVK